MNDMRAVIVPKSDQLNADHLLAGPLTITISDVSIRPGTEQPVSIHFEGDNGKPYKPCKSMCKVMVACWGPDANAYAGRSLTLFCDPKVKWGGMAVGGIRISHMTHIDGAHTMALTETKGNKKPFVVKPLKMPEPPKREAEAATEAPDFDAPPVDRMRQSTDRLLSRIAACTDEDCLHDLASDPNISAGRAKIAAARPELEQEIGAAFIARFQAVQVATPEDDVGGAGETA